MRAVIQRVSRASVTVAGEVTGRIGTGLVVLVGVGVDDDESDADYLVQKIAGLRIFDDLQGRMNLSLSEVGGALLVISQFTLYADVRRGRRPSWADAAGPEKAERLYDYFVGKIRDVVERVETGRFRAMMQVDLVNEGPVTIIINSPRDEANEVSK
jgi:D-tyrosyl-tRNA(Tyr) deacylase